MQLLKAGLIKIQELIDEKNYIDKKKKVLTKLKEEKRTQKTN